MVYRIYVEKKSGLDNEAVALLHEAVNILQIKVELKCGWKSP